MTESDWTNDIQVTELVKELKSPGSSDDLLGQGNKEVEETKSQPGSRRGSVNNFLSDQVR